MGARVALWLSVAGRYSFASSEPVRVADGRGVLGMTHGTAPKGGVTLQPAIGDAAGQFRLRTLGRLVLTAPDGTDEPSLATRPRKLAVLAWLALRPDRSATRDRIIGVFWGGRDDERARNSLSDVLSHLRRVLGRDAIRTRADEVALAADAPLVVDAMALAEAARREAHEDVVALYGGAFLDGFHVDDAHDFDDWCERTRARLAALFARSAAARCASLASDKRWDECRALAERWLDADPASADAANALLDAILAPQTHASRVAALVACQSLSIRLHRDLGVSPAPEVMARAREIAVALEATGATQPVVATRPASPRRVVPMEGTGQAMAEAAPVTPQATVTRTVVVRPSQWVWWGVGMAAVLVGAVSFSRAMTRNARDLDPRRVVVDVFENRTGDTTLAMLGRVAAEWVARGLTETGAVEVVELAPLAVPSAREDAQALGRRANAGSVVLGSYLRRGDSVVIEARLVDAADGRVLRAVDPVVLHPSQPLPGVEVLWARVAGAVASQLDPMITAVAREGRQPSTHAAYQPWVQGLELFSQHEFAASIPPFLEAAALDTTFLTAIIWAAAAHGNIAQWHQTDSLIQVVDAKRANFGPLDQGLLDLWRAAVRGDNLGGYNATRRMLAEAPNSELALFLAAWHATKVYRPNEAINLLRRMPVERSKARWDRYGTQLSTAYHVAGRYDEELTEARRRRKNEPRWLPAIMDEARALVAVGHSDELRRLAAEIGSLTATRPYTVGSALHFAAQEARVHGRHDDEMAILAHFDDWMGRQGPDVRESAANRRLLGIARYQQGKWVEADTILSALLRQYPNDATLLGWVGVTAAQRGDSARASRISTQLAELEATYLYGSHTIGRARIAVVAGQRASAIALTRQAVSEGQVFRTLHLLPELVELRGEPEFDALFRVIG